MSAHDELRSAQAALMRAAIEYGRLLERTGAPGPEAKSDAAAVLSVPAGFPAAGSAPTLVLADGTDLIALLRDAGMHLRDIYLTVSAGDVPKLELNLLEIDGFNAALAELPILDRLIDQLTEHREHVRAATLEQPRRRA